ncbi:hypothetical protein NKJ46_21590 [Mesorhizobium sp. M0166]
MIGDACAGQVDRRARRRQWHRKIFRLQDYDFGFGLLDAKAAEAAKK